LIKERFGGDETVARNWLAQLGQLRDRILRSARLKSGEVFLDVGCGDGLLGFGALSQVGSSGRVIFSDQSKELIEKCRCDARTLLPIEDDSVTVRSATRSLRRQFSSSSCRSVTLR
jgi:ubiquinone/menaquinone biosynthesis C-methylase UbiE